MRFCTKVMSFNKVSFYGTFGYNFVDCLVPSDYSLTGNSLSHS